MSNSWFILPYDPKAWEDPNDTAPKPTSDLIMEPTIFDAQIRAEWPNLERYESPNSNHWQLLTENHHMEIILYEDKQFISFRAGHDELFCKFVLWYRTFVPLNNNLFLCNASSFARIELTEKTNSNDVLEFALHRRLL